MIPLFLTLITIVLFYRLVVDIETVSALKAQIVHYPNITLSGCGIGRESALMDDMCFEFHKGIQVYQSIRNGRGVSNGEMPFTVLIRIARFNNKTDSLCSGVILNDYWIVTAGHCIKYDQNNPIIDIWVWTGLRDSRHIYNKSDPNFVGPQTFILDWIVHPLYDLGQFENNEYLMERNDIGLLYYYHPFGITRNTSLSYTNINSVCLPKINTSFGNSEGEYALFSGWGRIDSETQNRGIMRMGWNVINGLKSDFNLISMDYNNSDDRPVVCHGDSGGPLVQYVGGRAVLIGIISGLYPKHSDYCPNRRTKGINFTNIGSKMDWIFKTIRETTLFSENITRKRVLKHQNNDLF